MTLNEAIITAVSPIIPVCVPDFYETGAGESAAQHYCTFNYDEQPAGFGDDRARTTRTLVQVHYFAPRRVATLKTRQRLRDALAAVAAFTTPGIENASDIEGQHYVLEFEAVGKWDADDAES